jgi:hypothetical protein
MEAVVVCRLVLRPQRLWDTQRQASESSGHAANSGLDVARSDVTQSDANVLVLIRL